MMKKLMAIVLAVLLLATVAGCAAQQPPKETEAPTAPVEEQTQPNATEPDVTEPAAQEVFSFVYEGVELVPGTALAQYTLPEADSVFTVPSCAIEGTDNVYSYPSFELTAYNDGTGEVIYSIYLLDANTATTEGLYVGDDLARVTELYGTDYIQNDTELIFTRGGTTLNLLLDGESVISIEYRMVV